MPTYEDLRDSGIGKSVFWVEISGIPIIPHTGGLTPEMFEGDGYTDDPALQFLNILKEPGSTTAKSIDLLSADAKTSGFQIEMIDAPVDVDLVLVRDNDDAPLVQWTASQLADGILTFLLGSERTTIGRAHLTEDIDLSETSWTIDNGTLQVLGPCYDGCPAPEAPPCIPQTGYLIAYNGLETVTYLNPCTIGGGVNPDVLNILARSAFHSEARPYRGKVFGTTTFREEVTDHPTIWKGRFVHLFHTYIDPLGRLATGDGTTAGARAAARRITGVLDETDEGDGTYTFRCKGLEVLLERVLLRAPPRARISPRTTVDNGHIVGGDGGAWDDDGAVLYLEQYDEANPGTEEVWFVGIPAPISYTDEEFVRAVNERFPAIGNGMNGQPFYGQLTMSLDQHSLRIRYTLDAVNPRSVRLDFGNGLTGGGDTGDYWATFGLLPDGNEQVRLADPIDAGRNEYLTTIPRAPYVVIPGGVAGAVVVLEPGAGEAPASAFNNGEEYAVFESEAGREVVRIAEVHPASNTVDIDRQVFATGQYPEHAATADTPVYLKQIYVGTGLRKSTLRLLLSVSGTGYNESEYDVLPEGFGIGIPNEVLNAGTPFDEGLIDIGAFERFLVEGETYINQCFDVIDEPMSAREWLRKRVEFFNGYIAMEDGKLVLGKGLAATRDQARRITHKLAPEGTKRRWKRAHQHIVRGVHYLLNWKHGRKIWRDSPYWSLSDSSANPEDRWVERADRGIWMTVDQSRLLAEELLEELGHENPVISTAVNRILSDLQPGDAVLFSDEGADEPTQPWRRGRGLPNLQGTRGHRQTPCIVLGARGTTGKQLGLTLFVSRKKRGGYSPGAWIVTLATDTPSAGTTRLNCEEQFFMPSTIGVDVEGFVVGEKVKVIRVSAPTGAVGESAGHTVSAIDVPNNRIEIQPNVAGAGIVSGECLILVHDDYQTASQPQTAKDWCAIGDDSGDIGDTADPCYDW